jgi:hypothetical protein
MFSVSLNPKSQKNFCCDSLHYTLVWQRPKGWNAIYAKLLTVPAEMVLKAFTHLNIYGILYGAEAAKTRPKSGIGGRFK